jgi:hypothetical protein
MQFLSQYYTFYLSISVQHFNFFFFLKSCLFIIFCVFLTFCSLLLMYLFFHSLKRSLFSIFVSVFICQSFRSCRLISYSLLYVVVFATLDFCSCFFFFHFLFDKSILFNERITMATTRVDDFVSRAAGEWRKSSNHFLTSRLPSVYNTIICLL